MDRNNRLQFNLQQIKRETRRRLMLLGIVSLITAFAFFVLGLLLFPLTAELLDSSDSVDWGLLEGITNLIAVALVVGGLVLVSVEYWNNEVQSRRASAEASYNIYRDLFDRLTNDENTAGRRWIIQNIDLLPTPCTEEQKMAWLQEMNSRLDARPSGWENEIPPGRAHLKLVLNTFDYIGFVSQYYWNMDNELYGWMSPLVVKVWERIDPFVEAEAVKRNEHDFYAAAVKFGRDCIKWRKNANFPPSNIIDNAT